MIPEPKLEIPDLSKWNSTADDYNEFDIYDVSIGNPLTDLLVGKENDIAVTHRAINEIHVTDASGNVWETPMFFKHAPLLDPLHYMIGRYDEDSRRKKIEDIHNAAYVDHMAYLLIGQLRETHQFIHGIQYHGSFMGIQREFRMNIFDDLDYLQEHAYFNTNVGTLFHTNVFSHVGKVNKYSSKNRPTLEISDVSDNIVVDASDMVIEKQAFELENAPCDMEEVDIDALMMEGENVQITSVDSDVDSIDDDEISEQEKSDQDEECIDDDSGSDVSSCDDSEEPLYAYIHNFPVQTIALERCTQTFDRLLLHDEIDEDTGRSALFQIIVTLFTLQKAFHLTHNDLHTNNIMYTDTDHPFVNYHILGKWYRVPTFGRIYKIIDFGRAIYRTSNHLFCSDSFARDGDGDGQYNTEPFYDPEKPRVDPNYSFDLCRLGCAIYDFVIDDDMKMTDMDGFQRIVMEWCHDDKNRNILYKRNGEERYPDFKLYKMIARTVSKHTPERQFEREYFKEYETYAPMEDEYVMDIDAIPALSEPA